jgi:hypothetical protein
MCLWIGAADLEGSIPFFGDHRSVPEDCIRLSEGSVSVTLTEEVLKNDDASCLVVPKRTNRGCLIDKACETNKANIE